MYKITVIPGDGIGQEVMQPTIDILETLNSKFEFIPKEAGKECYQKYDTNLPEETIVQCRESDSTLFGAVTSIPQQKSAIRKITYKASERIINYAFNYALKTEKSKVTASHKANVLPVTDGIFKNTFYKVASNYPTIKSNDYYIDAMAMYLITNPAQFDIIVTTNLFGDILSDEGGGLVGTLGLIPSANIGDKTGLFEPVHGSAPDIAGLNKANPIAMILSSCLMLEYLGLYDDAKRIQNAVEETISESKVKTPDMGGHNNTQDVANNILHRL